jgi:hypothetical protein
MKNITKAGFLMGGLAMTAAVALTAAPSGAQEDDLNCGDPGTSLNMPVPPDDPHGLDADGDGIGCEDPSAFANSGGSDTTTTTAVTPPAAAPAPAEPVEMEPSFTG